MRWSAWVPSFSDAGNGFAVLAAAVLVVSIVEPLFNPDPEAPRPPGQMGSYPGTIGNVGYVLHFFGGIGFAVTGVCQFVAPLRQYFPKIHRIVGYAFFGFQFITLCGNLVFLFGRTAYLKGGVSSFIAATFFFNPWWVYCSVRSLRAILRGSVHEHHMFIIRGTSLALGNALVPASDSVLRIIVDGIDPKLSYAAGFWFAFASAIVVGELCVALVYPAPKNSVPVVAPANTAGMYRELAAWTELSLVHKEQSGNYFTLVFEAPFNVAVLPSHHVTFKHPDKFKCFKPYTPISTHGRQLEFLIKRYERGTMSQYLTGLEVGNRVLACGPSGTFEFDNHAQVLMIAAGTGITPMISILKTSLDVLHLETNFKLVFFNKEPLLDNHLSDLRARFPEKFEYEFVSDRTSYSVLSTLQSHVPEGKPFSYTGSNASVLVCGPPRFCDDMVSRALALQIPRSEIFVFGFSDR